MAFVLDASVDDDLDCTRTKYILCDAARNLDRCGGYRNGSRALVVRSAECSLVGERRGRLKRADTAYFLAQLADLPIETDSAVDEAIAFRMARQHNLTFYDASYLALAHSRDVPLATLDRALIAAAPHEDVELVGTP